MTLPELVLAAMLSVARGHVAEPVERPRLEGVAEAIAAASEGQQSFSGPAGREAMALALAAVAFHESGYLATVQDCRRRGDLEISKIGAITLWQLLGQNARGGHKVEALCTDVGLAARRARELLDRYGRKAAQPLAMFDGYSSGSAAVRTNAGRRQCAIWERMARGAGLRGAVCWKRQEITR